jgi:hypothetical protein
MHTFNNRVNIRSADTDPPQLARRAAAVAIATAVGLGAAVTAPAGIAHAYSGSCSGPVGAGNILGVREFSLQDVGNGNSLVTVEVNAAMSESDARLFVDRPGDKAEYFLFGDDTGSDELLTVLKPDRYWASPSGLGMRGGGQVPNDRLNEDSIFDVPPDRRDEFFVDIRMGDIRTGGAHRLETCRLSLLG